MGATRLSVITTSWRQAMVGCAALLLLLTATLPARAVDATVLVAAGEVVVVRATPGAPVVPVGPGMALDAGDLLRTGHDGRVQIRFTDGALVSLQPRTEFRIDEYRFDGGDQRGFFSLLRGTLRTATGAIGKRNREDYQLRTPTAVVGIRGTQYLAEETVCDPVCFPGTRAGLRVSVAQGRIAVTSRAGTIEVGEGESAAVDSADSFPHLTLFGPVVQPVAMRAAAATVASKGAPSGASGSAANASTSAVAALSGGKSASGDPATTGGSATGGSATGGTTALDATTLYATAVGSTAGDATAGGSAAGSGSATDDGTTIGSGAPSGDAYAISAPSSQRDEQGLLSLLAELGSTSVGGSSGTGGDTGSTGGTGGTGSTGDTGGTGGTGDTGGTGGTGGDGQLASGTSPASQWSFAFAASVPGIGLPSTPTGSSIVLDSQYRLESIGLCPASPCLQRGTAQFAEADASGYVTWGRWTDGTVTRIDAGVTTSVVLSANQGIHYLIGSPAVTAPTAGAYRFNLLGATAPTISNGTLAPGTFTGAAGVEFKLGGSWKLGLEGTVAIGSATFAFSTAGGAAAPGKSTLTAGSSKDMASGWLRSEVTGINLLGCTNNGCRVDLTAQLFGPTATQLGVQYSVGSSTTSTTIDGVSVFRRP